ncbi:capsular exopolysaccharide synthesis family protein [Bacillus mesophilus]|uniref:non-specific protein-tyrosine kinase n=1 Tax=Bacillus mesophilus TaxID=1808955 RepID=A0A6M0Q7J0_9BACI|nr:polysaccharide biosynthesis tyrosine autokinase [Bacillus mesophilus]MBM7661648.1 capsular exopolysaccharide synthesis family protein [Bacillus mesophilus]NEY72316.1 polysaccharide biosynthesis tyrosine autokinase [Bacillus mesophilus]
METTFDVRHLLLLLVRNTWLIVILTLSIIGITAAVSFYLITPVYEAKSDILVTMKNGDGVETPTPGEIDSSLKLVETYRVIIQSPTILEPVIQTLSRDIQLDDLLDKVTIRALDDTQVFSIMVRDEDLGFAVEAANAIAIEFQKQTIQLMNLDNVHILSPAKVPSIVDPVSPKPIINIVISVFLGIFFSLGVVLIKEYFNTTLATEEKVRKFLHLSVLGEIPSIKNKKLKKESALLSAHNELFYKLIPRCKNQLINMEAYQNIIANLKLAKEPNGKTILVTSPNQSEGKSMTSANLAIVLAKSKKRIVYVDMDLRRPSGHYAFHLSNQRGVTSILKGNLTIEECIQHCEISNLSIITSGPIPPYSSQTLTTEEVSGFFKELKQLFDVIIIDSPPMFVSDTAILSPLADGCLVVVNAKKTRYPVTQKCLARLKNAGANLLGVVINDKKVKTMPYYY